MGSAVACAVAQDTLARRIAADHLLPACGPALHHVAGSARGQGYESLFLYGGMRFCAMKP